MKDKSASYHMAQGHLSKLVRAFCHPSKWFTTKIFDVANSLFNIIGNFHLKPDLFSRVRNQINQTNNDELKINIKRYYSSDGKEYYYHRFHKKNVSKTIDPES